MALTKAQRKKLGKCYLPKYPVVGSMCSSCPFGKTESFKRKKKELGIDVRYHAEDILTKRDVIAVISSGREFMCHDTVYTDEGRYSYGAEQKRKLCKGGVMWKKGEL